MKYQVNIGRPTVFVFDGKPSVDVRNALKRYGYRWSPSAGHWWSNSAAGAADLCQFLDRQRNLAAGLPAEGHHKCWTCGSDKGVFRHEGAACPVRCDCCQAWKNIAELHAESVRAEDRALAAYVAAGLGEW